MANLHSVPVDVRGGICGGTDKTGQCGEPLFFGHCEHHGRRVTPDPMAAPLVDRVAQKSRPKRGPFSAPVVHPEGWIDGRTKAGRALKASRQ